MRVPSTCRGRNDFPTNRSTRYRLCVQDVVFGLVSDDEAALYDVDELGAFVNVLAHLTRQAFGELSQIRLKAFLLR